MPLQEPDRQLNQLSRDVIGAFYDVYNELGYGLSEKLYSVALGMILEERGFLVAREVVLDIVFHGRRIGHCRADMVVNGALVVEIKAGSELQAGARLQLYNYLRRSGLLLGLLLYFGPSAQFKRIVMSAKS